MNAARNDKRLLAIVAGGMAVLVLAVAVFAPRKSQDDPEPSTTNNGPAGIKAAYMTLERLGRHVARWQKPLLELNSSLSDDEAARSTLVLAEPRFAETERKDMAAALHRFVERGGRVLVTGGGGALLLGGDVRPPQFFQTRLCESSPEGPGPLAAAGVVEMSDHGAWSSESPQYFVEQRCGGDAVVVTFAVGKGTAVWWTSATPMDNAELNHDANLRLLLASLGEGREVLFDEALHGAPRTLWDAAKGLPLTWLVLQAVLLFLLMIFSFSRRRGPVRAPLALPRTSPVEFAASMGDLYERGGATVAAVRAARRRLLQMLGSEAGLPAQVLAGPPAEIAAGLSERLPGDWSVLAQDLTDAQHEEERISPRSALSLVRALHRDADTVRERIAS